MFVKLCQQFIAPVEKLASYGGLCVIYLLLHLFKIIRQLTNTITSKLIIHKLCILFLNLTLLRNDLCLLAVMDVDTVEQQVVLVVDLVVDDCQRMRGVIFLLLLQVVDDCLVGFLANDVVIVLLMQPFS